MQVRECHGWATRMLRSFLLLDKEAFGRQQSLGYGMFLSREICAANHLVFER